MYKRHWIKIIIFCCLASVLLSSCTLTTPVDLNKQLYTLNPKIIPIKKYPRSQQTILVLATQSIPELDSRKMMYMTQAHHIGYFSLHSWAAPPAEMLLSLIAQSLRVTHYYKAVLTAPYVGTTSLRLTTQLLQLQQDFRTHPSQIQIVLAAQLSNATTGKIIAAREFKAVVPALQQTPYGGVIAANVASTRILKQLAQFCVQASKTAQHTALVNVKSQAS